jgi:hypothetical protein
VNVRWVAVIDPRTGKPAPPPETQDQAEKAHNRATWLRALGVCHPCSVQGAFSRQAGAGPVRLPCDDCLPLVAALPGEWRKGWKVPSGPASGSLSRPCAVPGVVGPADALGRSSERAA